MTLSAQQLENNRLDLLSRLAGDISHEIKNPLHAMVINLELVRRKVEKGDAAPALARVAIIEEEIRKVHGLANALLESLRPPRDTQSTCGFSAVLQELAPLIAARARGARVELLFDAEPVATVVPLAAHELRLLLLNLADRAVRVTGSGGRLAIVVRADADTVTIHVACDQPPLDESERAWLHDHPVAAEHIDLGLRVVRHLLERHGGRIAATNGADGRPGLAVTLPGAASA